MSSRPEDTFFDFLSRLRQVEPAVRNAFGIGTVYSRPYSSIQKRYFRKFLKSEDMLYFTTLWYFNSWRPCEKRVCPYLVILRSLVKNMSGPDKRKYFRPLMDTFQVLIHEDHITALKNFLDFDQAIPKHLDVIPTFLDIFRILNPRHQSDSAFYEDALELCTEVVTECAEILNVCLSCFLTLMPYSDLDLILNCFSMQQYHLFFYQESDLLMRDLMKNKKGAKTLLRHGICYFFNSSYYEHCISNLKDSGIKVDGKNLGEEFKPQLANKCCLRYQMAVELLHALFSPDMSRRDKKIISMIWKAVPFTFITKQEMFQILEPFFYGRCIQLKDLCAIYARCNNIFPVPVVKTPRSLKHLCRIQVRENLFRVRNLCKGNVFLLEISPKLERYVWELNTF